MPLSPCTTHMWSICGILWQNLRLSPPISPETRPRCQATPEARWEWVSALHLLERTESKTGWLGSKDRVDSMKKARKKTPKGKPQKGTTAYMWPLSETRTAIPSCQTSSSPCGKQQMMLLFAASLHGKWTETLPWTPRVRDTPIVHAVVPVDGLAFSPTCPSWSLTNSSH